MVGKTNTKAKYSTCVGTRFENGFVNNFETHGASYVTDLLLSECERGEHKTRSPTPWSTLWST